MASVGDVGMLGDVLVWFRELRDCDFQLIILIKGLELAITDHIK